MANKRILIIGSANMDLLMNMYKVPEAGQTVIDDGGVAYLPGGKGANAAVAFARLGGASVLCARLGADVHGQKLHQFYRESGIDTTYIKADRDNPTGLAVVMKEGDGSNRIVVYPGANWHLSADNVADAFACQPDAVYIGFEIPFAVAVAAAKYASERNIPIFVDPAPADKELPLESLPRVEIFSPNESETLEYTGINPQGTDSSLRAALAMYRRVKCKYLVIKQGERGAFVYDGRHYNFVPAFRVGRPVDTTAAGDAFTAALTLKYLENGGDIYAAAKFGAAAGALTVKKRGASSSIPTRAEVEALLSDGDFQ